MLTPLQKIKHEYIFNLIDFDRNGFIEHDDFIGIAENLCNVRGEELDTPESQLIYSQCQNLWKGLENHIDQDHDKKCTMEEWLTFIEKRLINNASGETDELLNTAVCQLFDMYDVDNNGQISLSEFLDIFLSFHLNASLVGKSFLSLDADRDSSISRPELVSAIKDFLLSNDIQLTGNWIFGDIYQSLEA